MRIVVKYFGALAEQTGQNQDVFDLKGQEITLNELKTFCTNKYALADFNQIQLAVNQELAENVQLKDGDEVAFLPPFAGG